MGHGHGHSHAPSNYGKAFAVGIGLNVGFVLVEVAFGVASHSLALLADAGHNASDVLGLLLAWGAMILSKKRPSERRTYGLRRSSVLAALGNAVLLLVAIGGIAWEAVHRFHTPAPVAGVTVMWVAAIGIAINAATALMFVSGRKSDINIEGAFLHMAADASVSLGVVIAGFLMLWTGWTWLDPVVSLAIVAVIAVSTWGLLRKSVNLAMDAVPEGIDASAVRQYMADLPGVKSVHDFHIWGMSTTEAALTAHIVRTETADNDAFLVRVSKELHDRFGIEHVTVQIEHGTSDAACPLAPDTAV